MYNMFYGVFIRTVRRPEEPDKSRFAIRQLSNSMRRSFTHHDEQHIDSRGRQSAKVVSPRASHSALIEPLRVGLYATNGSNGALGQATCFTLTF